MTRGRHRRDESWRRRIVLRLLDQVAWSAGFFCFNLAATLVLPTDQFALLAVATSIVFMGVAIARAWAVGSRIVVATKLKLPILEAIDARSMLAASVIVGIMVVASTTLTSNNPAPDLFLFQVVLLVFGLVAADMPRQGLIYSSRYHEALYISVAYVLLSLCAFFFSAILAIDPMLLWMLSAYLCAGLGWLFHHNIGWGASLLPRGVTRSHAWRMTAESVYTSVASQLALLLLYAFTDASSTAGYRLSYSLVFAPAFMLLQGIAPLLAVQFSGEITKTGRARLKTWLSGPILTLGSAALCGLAGLIAAISPLVPSLIASVVPFLLPVGLSLAGAQVLEFLLLGTRYFVSEHAMHRMRLLVVTVDVIVQALAIALAGVNGLVLALIILATMKLIASLALAAAVWRGRFTSEVRPAT